MVILSRLWRHLRADGYKLKGSSLLWAHLIVPLIGAACMIMYYRHGRYGQLQLYTQYMELIAFVLPLVVGMICGLAALQEKQAGSFQVILGAQSRGASYVSKLLLLVLMGAFSIFFTILAFVWGMKVVLNVPDIRYGLFLEGGAWLVAGSILLYTLHLFLSFTFGIAASSLVGGAGLLVTALMVTALGDELWMFVPWAWSVRIAAYEGLLVWEGIDHALQTKLAGELKVGMLALCCTLILVIFLSIYWFRQWEGSKSDG